MERPWRKYAELLGANLDERELIRQYTLKTSYYSLKIYQIMYTSNAVTEAADKMREFFTGAALPLKYVSLSSVLSNAMSGEEAEHALECMMFLIANGVNVLKEFADMIKTLNLEKAVEDMYLTKDEIKKAADSLIEHMLKEKVSGDDSERPN